MDLQQMIEETISTWKSERPDLDFAPMALVLRLGTIAKVGIERTEQALAPLGITVGEFDVLATIRRHGASAELTPSALAELTLISQSGLTNRIRRLTDAGLLTRRVNESDKRSFALRLTAKGTKTVDKGITIVAALDTEFMKVLSRASTSSLKKTLDELLRGMD
jgi:DNA-binding MarR family transcriptional regulator